MHTETGDVRRQIGRRLKEQRVSAGLTQVELAYLVGFDGANGISAIENGRASIQPERYAAYSDALEMTQEDFVKVVVPPASA